MFFKSTAQRGDDQYNKGNYRKAAELYLKAELWAQAADSFVKSEQIDKAVKVYEDNGLYREAAALLSGKGDYTRACQVYEKAGELRQAAEMAKKGGNPERAGRLYEKAGRFDRAADCFFSAGNSLRAVDALAAESHRLRELRDAGGEPELDREIRTIDLRRAELPQLGRHLEAAQLLAEHGFGQRAAPLFERAGAFAEAARTHLDSGSFPQALTAIEKAVDKTPGKVDPELRAEIYLNCAHHLEAAQIFQEMERFGAAASAYEGGQAWLEAARMWEREGALGRAADLYKQGGSLADAGRCYLAASQPSRAAAAFIDADRPADAGRAFEQAGEPLQAGLQFLAAGMDREAREALLEVEPKTDKKNDKRYIKASLLLVPLLVDEGMIDGAQHRLTLLKQQGARVRQSDWYYCRGRIAEGQGQHGAAEKYYQRVVAEKPDFRDARQRLDDLRQRQSGPRPKTEGKTDDDGRSTAPIPIPDSDQAAGDGADETGTRPSVDSDAEELPYLKEERVSTWWNGADFFSGRDRNDESRRVLLVCFEAPAGASRLAALEQARRRASALRHPAVLRLEEVVATAGEEVLVYEHFDGLPIERWLRGTPPTPLVALQLIVQLCEAMSGAHKLGTAHRWLSLRTVLVDSKNRVKLAGLGLGELLSEHVENRSHLGPEARDGGLAGPASDVYSLGRLAITLLQARMPEGWLGFESLELAQVDWDEEVEKVVPAKIRELFLRCLAHDPLVRPSMGDLQNTLATIGLLPGQVLAERYEILGDLGSGGMSRVYRARDRVLDDEVAIKTVLSPAIGRTSEDEDRLLREVQISRKITHPNVVRVHDIGRFPGGIFVTMELLEGRGLDEIIQSEAPLPLHRVRDLMHGIAAALGEAHRLKIIHRDLKPGNVILTDGRVKVLDFGIARRSDASTQQLTRTGEVIGSPLYMAPEQIQGKPLDSTCDLYSLGVIAFTLLTGREPFMGDSPTSIVLQHLHDPPPDIRRDRPETPDPWAELLDRLLAKDPTARYQSAEEVSRAIAALPEA